MFPKILIGNYEIRGEGFLTFLAILGAFIHVIFIITPKSGYSKQTVINGFIFSLVVALISAVISHYLIWDFDKFKNNPSILLEGLVKFSGHSITGAIIGCVLGLIIYCKLMNLNFFHFSSCFSYPILLWMGLGRIACFCNGDAYGIPTTSIFGITFSEDSFTWMDEWNKLSGSYYISTNPLPQIEKIFSSIYGLHLNDLPIPDKLSLFKKEGFSTLADLSIFYKDKPSIQTLYAIGLFPFPTVYPKVHPTQLYDLFSLTTIYFVIKKISSKDWAKQRVMFIFFIAYGLNRFWIEFFRADKSPGLFGLTGAQLLCIGFIFLGIAAYVYYTLKWKKTGMPQVVLK